MKRSHYQFLDRLANVQLQTHLTLEHPQSAEDDDGRREQNVDDEVASDHGLLDISRSLLHYIVVNWFHAQTVLHTYITLYILQ